MAEVITVSAKNFAATFRVREVQRTKAVRGALVEAAQAGHAIVVAAINESKLVDVGTLKASVHVARTANGVELVLDAPHAGVLEGGSRPHTPPLQPLIDWVKRHRASFGISPVKPLRKAKANARPAAARRARLRAMFHAMATADHDAEVEGIARAIQGKIKKFGSKPHWFVRRSLPKMRDALGAVLQRRRSQGR